MRGGDLAQAFPIHRAGFDRGTARLRQAVIKSLRQRTGFAMTSFVGMFASLVARHQFQHPQR